MDATIAAPHVTHQATPNPRREGDEPVAAPRETRETILRATLRLIGEQGIGALSNRRIAAASGVALGSLTYHFGSQTELLRESLLLYVHEEVARVAALTDELRAVALTPAQVAAEVERIVRDSGDRVAQVAELELHLHAARDPELQEASRRCFDAYESLAVAALEALAVPEPERHAPTVVSVMYGLALRRLGTGEHDAAGTADALVTILRGAGR